MKFAGFGTLFFVLTLHDDVRHLGTLGRTGSVPEGAQRGAAGPCTNFVFVSGAGARASCLLVSCNATGIGH
jgi:hypothetical protein